MLLLTQRPCGVQVLALVAGSAGSIRSVHGWKTVCALVAVTSLHPEAAPVSMNALASVARASTLSAVAFTPVLEAVVSCIERNAKVSWHCISRKAYKVHVHVA